MSLSLIDFWPVEQNITECIRPEAETATESVFLAVHRPMTFLKRSTTDHSRAKPCNQEELLAEFLKQDLPSGTFLLPIIGNSGVGKSHMIRWLDAELRRQDDAQTRHIIRIPKSASLKQVLRIILADLDGPAYDEIRDELKSARDHIDPNTAAEELRAKLLVALDKKANVARDRVALARKNGERPEPEDRALASHAGKKGLQALFSDPVAAQNFMRGDDGTAGIIAQIAERVTQGWKYDEKVRNQFSAADLTLDEHINLSEASIPAQRYYNLINRTTKSDERDTALQILNDVIDDAIYQLLDLGDNRLTELFVRVREELWEEGRELILLVEDFAALAGIQGALLDVMIKEAVYDGKQIRCTMRTALAVTEGYLSNRETVMTRAEYEWVIEETSKSEEEVLAQIVDLVGGYLNAARFGEDELAARYDQSGAKELESWVPRFESTKGVPPDIQNRLDLFGESTDGYSLFPLNKASIRQLAYRYLRDADNRLRYNPRLVINKILRDTLNDHRADFAKGEFPSYEFQTIGREILNAQVRQEIYNRCSDKEQAKQAIGLVSLWGGSPRTWEAAEAIPAELYEVFSLPALTDGASPADVEQRAPNLSAARAAKLETPQEPVAEPSTEAEPVQPVSSGFERHPDEAEWDDVLNKWAAGEVLLQSKARKLREWIAESLYYYIDEDLHLLRNIKVRDSYFKRWIYIPGARGGESNCTADMSMVTVCREEDRTDDERSADIVLTLMAIIRHHLYESWDFPDAEGDILRYASFMESVAPQAVEFCSSRYFEVEADTVTAMGQALLIAARVLDLPYSHASEHTLLLESIFQDVPAEKRPDGERVGDSAWSHLIAGCLSVFDADQGNFRDFLLEQIGARQGGGINAHAIDAAQLLDALKELQSKWRLADDLTGASRGEYGRIYQHFGKLRKYLTAGVRERQEFLESWYAATQEWLGDSPEKEDIADQMRDTVTKAHTAGVKRGENKDAIHRLIRAFRKLAVTTVVSDVQRLAETDDPGVILSILARADGDVIYTVDTLRRMYGDFLDRTSSHIDNQLQAIGADVVERAVDQIDEELEELGELLDVLPSEDTNTEELEPV